MVVLCAVYEVITALTNHGYIKQLYYLTAILFNVAFSTFHIQHIYIYIGTALIYEMWKYLK